MLTTLVKILPLALTATISPTGLFFVMAILSGKGENPKRKALVFLIGGALFLVTLAAVILFTYQPTVGQSSQPSRYSGIIDIIFGVLIVALVARTLLFPKDEKKSAEGDYKEKKKKKRPYIVLGYLYMLTNVSTLIPFAAAVKLLAEANLGFWGMLPDLIILLLVTMLLVSSPVIVSYAMPEKSEVVLGPVKNFFSRHGRLLAQALFLVIAIYLIYEGVGKITR